MDEWIIKIIHLVPYRQFYAFLSRLTAEMGQSWGIIFFVCPCLPAKIKNALEGGLQGHLGWKMGLEPTTLRITI